jgi:hypothetical protein
MHDVLESLLQITASGVLNATPVIPWSSPVVAFGDPYTAKVATLGLNPSNLEFHDASNKELSGPRRRFETLNSLQLSTWDEATASDVVRIWKACQVYFHHNPYDRWFRRLEPIVQAVGASYYSKTETACHLDLVPFATSSKWGALDKTAQRRLLNACDGTLPSVLAACDIDLVILNGRSVVTALEQMYGISFRTEPKQGWELPRRAKPVSGCSFYLRTATLGRHRLGREVLFIGYNHNIQSSFGVTRTVVQNISNWVREVHDHSTAAV